MLNAVMGALPFLVIAIIELTKIPLASGLYRVKNFGWKIFILFSLLALTFVTFETMFTGLERQMTNITARVTDGKLKIQELSSKNENIVQEIQQIEIRDIIGETQGLSNQIEQAYEDTRLRLPDLDVTHERARAALVAQMSALATSKIDQEQALLIPYDAEINSKKENITLISAQASQTRQLINEKKESNDDDRRIKRLEDDIQEIINQINETENWLNSNETDQISRAQIRIGVIQDGRIGPNTRRNFEAWRQQKAEQISQNADRIEEIRLSLDRDVELLSSQLNQLQQNIESENDEIFQLEARRSELALSMLTAPPTPELTRIQQALNMAQSQLDELIERQNTERQQVIEQGQTQISELIDQRRILENEINEERARVPTLTQEINANKLLISELQNGMRQDARNNQVYRFAQKWGYFDEAENERRSYEDILDVKEKDLSFVGMIWFGSIAFICATMGTVLALVANIMTDPDAFVEKQRSRRARPIQRGLRRLFLMIRKKILRRREVIEIEKIVEVEKKVEVEKEVEKVIEIEKIVEIEKIIEKEVDKYVPEIILIPIFIPSDADHEAEMSKAAKYYNAINAKVDSAVKTFNKN